LQYKALALRERPGDVRTEPEMAFEVIRARAMGFCFGVRDALDRARGVVDPAQVTIHGELVHNAQVRAELTGLGFVQTPERARDGLPATPTVLITAHGVSERERARLVANGKRLIDTTCPLVERLHHAASRLARQGRHVLVVGRRGHVEVRGVVEDLPSCTVVEHAEEVERYPSRRLGIVCQTTSTTREVAAIRAAVARANPRTDIVFVDTVCRPTRDRQEALDELCDVCDAVVVVGGANSHNTGQLVRRCLERGVPALHVTGPADLDDAWFSGLRVVGLTAGTSTPGATIDAVETALRAVSRAVA